MLLCHLQDCIFDIFIFLLSLFVVLDVRVDEKLAH